MEINKTNSEPLRGLKLFLSDDQHWSGRQREGVEEDEPGVGETAARRPGGGAAAEVPGVRGEETQDGAQAEVQAGGERQEEGGGEETQGEREPGRPEGGSGLSEEQRQAGRPGNHSVSADLVCLAGAKYYF